MHALEHARDAWEKYKVELDTRKRLVVTCAIGNRGAGATSLKPQALFRANVASGHYLDFEMRLKGYDSTVDLASLPSESFKVVQFQSEEVRSMNASDQLRFKTFLSNASPTTLYVADVRGRTYASNAVPFAAGVYEQRVYDLLKQFAAPRTR